MYSTPVIVPLLCGNVGIHFEDNNFIPFKKGTIESTNKAGYHTKLLIISNIMIFFKCERDNIVWDIWLYKKKINESMKSIPDINIKMCN